MIVVAATVARALLTVLGAAVGPAKKKPPRRRLWRPKGPAFGVVTWNVYHGTPLNELDPLIDDELATLLPIPRRWWRPSRRARRVPVSVFLLQEASRRGLADLLKSKGLGTHKHDPELMVAWRTDTWDLIRRDGGELTKLTWRFRFSPRRIRVLFCRVRLRHRETGYVNDFVSYHTPPGVQKGGPSPKWPERIRALKDAMLRGMPELARQVVQRVVDAVVAGGDDNADETRAPNKWRFMYAAATGLQLIHPPKGTHAAGRKLDDFRVRGVHVGGGQVAPGGGDHKKHRRVFQNRRRLQRSPRKAPR